MIKNVSKVDPTSPCASHKLQHNGWSAARRARQAALIRRWQPWRHSTGPRTRAGKARCAMNARKHGFRSRPAMFVLRRVRDALRLSASTLAALRPLIRGLKRSAAHAGPRFAPHASGRPLLPRSPLTQSLEKAKGKTQTIVGECAPRAGSAAKSAGHRPCALLRSSASPCYDERYG